MKIREISYDQLTPIDAYSRLCGSCILEFNQYAFVGIDLIESLVGGGDYAASLRALRARYSIQTDDPLALHIGAPIGYVGYDKSFHFNVYRTAAVFDHERRRAILATLGSEEELDALYQKLAQPLIISEIAIDIGKVEVDVSDCAFAEMVERAQEHLRAGDIYQIVLSRTFKAELKGDPFQFYRALRIANPAPFRFFFDFGTAVLTGASPEKIISIQDGVIESTPIAGTCPNTRPLEAFLADQKENAEHDMLVDLARNDVGAVSIPGSVLLSAYKSVQPFANVHHLVSKVRGELHPDFDPIDAFQASFPAGTLSGAPKKRAMELIDQIETGNRGIYGGGIIALDAKGNLISCITIRTCLIQNGEMTVRAGAGIVLDSDPKREAEETRLKANTILGVVYAHNHR